MNLEKPWFVHFIHGTISGMCGTLLSFPFDTIKTSIQNKQAINYNIKSLYRGVKIPLLGVGFEKAIVFGTYTNIMKFSNQENKNYIIPLSGACSGFICSFLVGPVERIKILLQTNQKINNITPKYLFKGLSATLTRETPGFAIYFTVYEYLKHKFYINHNKKITTTSAFLFGGFSGFVSWCFIFGQDTIKTKMQASTTNKTFLNTTKEIYNEGGLLRFYKGFHFALMRAVPLHAGTFATMEFLKNINL